VNEGVVERGEDTGNTEDELACRKRIDQYAARVIPVVGFVDNVAPSRTWGPREMFSVAPRSTFFFGAILLM
jgi:hypothetical protein